VHDHSESSAVIRDTSLYTGSTYAAQLVVFFLGLVTKRFLGPANQGIWTLIQIINGYLPTAELGLSDAVAREFPYWKAKGEEQRASSLVNVMFTFNLLAAVVLSVGIFGYTLLVFRDQSLGYVVGLLVIGVMLPLSRWIACTTILFRSSKRFLLLSKTNIVLMIFNGITSLVLVWAFGLYGMYGSFILMALLNWLYWKKLNNWKPYFEFRLKASDLLHLLRIGIPLALSGIAFTLLRTVDSILVNSYLGAAQLGAYSIGVSMSTFIFSVPNALSIVMFPRFQERFGSSNDDRESLIPFINKPITVLAFFLLPVIMALAFFIGPELIYHILPRFVEGIFPFKVLLAGTFFISLTHMPGQFLITIRKQWMGVVLTIFSTVVLVMLNMLALEKGYGLAGVAAATSLAYFLSFALGLA